MYSFRQMPAFTYRLIWVVVLVLSFSLFSCGALFYFESKERLVKGISDNLHAILVSTVAQFDIDRHEGIFLESDGQLSSPEDFDYLTQILTKIETDNNLRDPKKNDSGIYTLRKVESDNHKTPKLEFVTMSLMPDQKNFSGNQIKMESHHKDALAGRTVITNIYQDEAGQWISAVTPLIDEEGKIIGLLQVDRNIDAYKEVEFSFIKQIITAIFWSLLLSVFIVFAFCYRLCKPLTEITEATHRIGEGDLNYRIPTNRKNQLKRLVSAINTMANKLEASQKELTDYNNQLENKVKQRTQNLVKLNEQLKRQQEQLVSSEKMASLGTLAAGIAHEINNPIGFVTSNISTLKRYLDEIENLLSLYKTLGTNEPQHIMQKIASKKEQIDFDYMMEDLPNLLEETENGVSRVQTIVGGLKIYSHQNDSSNQLIDIIGLLEANITIASNELKYHCKIERKFSELPKIPGNPGELNQVFLNLLINASHAIDKEHADDGQGRLILRAEPFNGDQVIIYICDNGCGISEENLKNIFDPFFTTKPVGVGSGLGLSITYSIINNHGGEISVKSEVGKGTCFIIKLPLNP